MNRRGEPTVPEPSYLPPNPSVGELVTEIDRARHEATRTMTALTRKFDTPAVRTAASMTRPLAHYARVGVVAGYARRVPTPVWIIAVLMLFRWWRRRHTH